MIIIQKIIAPNNYLYYMKLGANDLKIMITEVAEKDTKSKQKKPDRTF